MNTILETVEILKVENIKYPISLRRQTSDEVLLESIFGFKEYELPFAFSPNFIIDGGANVGYSAVYFANKYPDAKIICVEPEESNFRLLEYNTFFYHNIQRIRSGIWDKDCMLKVKDIGLGKWGFVVEACSETESGALSAVSIGTILAKSGFAEIDLLKLDIEGSEKEVFSGNYENWLPKVKVLIIELHDRMKQGCSSTFFKAISQYPFEFMMRGENLIFVRQ